MQPLHPERRRAGETLLAYLAASDPLPAPPADAVIGFGMFDLRLARFCGDLYRRGSARRIVFTGGIGAGTGKLGGPEADAWLHTLREAHPNIPAEHVIVENRSTNTAENISFTAALLARDHPALTFGAGLRTAVIVASPSRLRRVLLTLRKLQPALNVVRQCPPFEFADEQRLYAANDVDYIDHLSGEIDRLRDYPARGWIVPEPLPPEIIAAQAVLHRT